jgi:hypothetical protein
MKRLKDFKSNIRNHLSDIRILKSIYDRFKLRFIAYKKAEIFFKINKKPLESILAENKTGKRILFATSMGSELVAWRLEVLLGLAMSKRGHHIEYAINDGILTACQDCTYKKYEKDMAEVFKSQYFTHKCNTCFNESTKIFKKFNIKVNGFSDGLGIQEYEEIDKLCSSIKTEDIKKYTWNNVSVGEHALAGTLRFFAKATLEDEPTGEIMLKSYFRAALITTFSFKNILSKREIDIVVLHHGIYVPQGLICSLANEMGVKVVTWNIAYRKNRFIFSHTDTYHHTLISESVSKWKNIKWTNNKNEELLNYLKGRWYGDDDWINFNQENPQSSKKKVLQELGLDRNKPCIALLTNVLWDAQLHYPANAFENMLEWIFTTIEFFTTRKDIQLVIRVHPAEISGRIKSRQRVADEIFKKFKKLPSNIKIIKPLDSISSYDLVSVSNTALIFGTKMGVELTASGIPVIVAGEAWIRGKGLTDDANNKEDYIEKLNQLPITSEPNNTQTLNAKKYAYHFFFRRMIPLLSVKEAVGWPPFDIKLKNLDELEPGHDPGLDVICDGIVSGSDFIFDAND